MLCLGAAWLLCVAQVVRAQQPASDGSDAPDSTPRKSRRKLGRVARPADFTGAGLLQFEYGYDGDFHQPGTAADQTATASLLFNATEDLQVEFDFDAVHALSGDSSRTAAGIGDAYASAQYTAFSEVPRRPSLGMRYLVKFPAADARDGLGTGRVDHKLGLLVSKRLAALDVDVNASLLVNGRPETRGWETGYQVALGVSHELTRSLSLQSELFGETLDTDQPRGLFVQGGLTYRPTTRVSIDVGVRAGLSSDAPRVGAVAGVSLALTNLRGATPPAGAGRHPAAPRREICSHGGCAEPR
jgi:opacity protein-like surface antigen